MLVNIVDGVCNLGSCAICHCGETDSEPDDRSIAPFSFVFAGIQRIEDEDGIEHMYLGVIHIHENEATGELLPELIDSLRSVLPDDARDLLEDGLVNVRYSDAHRERYSTNYYKYLGSLFFQVREGFPRLARDHVPDGVKKVRYELALDACKSFQVEGSRFLIIS